MPRQSFSSVCPRRTPPIPVRRLIPAAEKENAPPRKGRTRKSREKENIESARGLLDIFAFVAKRRKCDFDAGRRAALIRHWRIAYIFQPLQNKKNELTSINSFLVGEGGFEPPKSLTTDLQSAPFGHSGILPYLIELLVKKWSWWTDSNPRPADYKSAALPAELYQHLSNEQVVYYQTSIRLSTGNLKKGGILLYAGKRHHDSVHAVCSLCAQDIYAGETLWYRNGVTVCADCFPRFAREALRSFEYISGEASTL